MALRALLDEIRHFCYHVGAVEVVLQLLQVVVGPQLAREWVAVGQVHDGVNLGLEDDDEVKGFAVLQW